MMNTPIVFFYNLIFLFFQLPLSYAAQPFRHSTSGEYFVDWKEIGPCPPNERGTNEIFADIHLTRRHRRPEAVGNITFKVDFDDTTPLRVTFAILGSNSGWLPNAYDMTFPRGCTDGFVGMLRDGWLDYMKTFNMTPQCPMRKGFYQTKGYFADDFLKNSILPKQFIYGRYKIKFDYLTQKNVLIGCSYFIIDLKPLWQKKKKEQSD